MTTSRAVDRKAGESPSVASHIAAVNPEARTTSTR
jgi:hypothetical protein